MRGLAAWVAASAVLAGCVVTGPPSPIPWLGAAAVDLGVEPTGPPLPAVPLGLDPEGALKALPKRPEGFAACAPSALETLQTPDADDILRYYAPRDWQGDIWYGDRVGAALHADELAPGQGALASWREHPEPGLDVGRLRDQQAPLVWVLRPEAVVVFEGATDTTANRSLWPDGIVAFVAYSTRFCDVLTWRTGPLASQHGAEHLLFESAHFSAFNPAHVVATDLPPPAHGHGRVLDR